MLSSDPASGLFLFYFLCSGVTSLDTVDESAVERHLLTKGLPDPDLLIRTSGEKRVRRDLEATILA